MNALKEESMQIENNETTSNSPSQQQAQLSPFEEKISLQKKNKKRERSPSKISRKVALQLASTSSSPISAQNLSTNSASQQQPNNDATQLTNGTTAQVVKKEKQRPETWNKIEQQIFFNALRQNGKNFEAITQYFNTRQKRYKIDAVQRSKEQIRHFFYRTWHKISKYISLPKVDESIHDIQVNCLIAFNALMNKSHRWNKKSALKLVELINHGWTTVRKKGKITRLRMPICKSSKNSVTTNMESNVTLPQTISVYLHPKHEISFCRVQKLAQNPYLMIEVQSTQSVKQLISLLENKWKDRRMEFLEKLFVDSSDETFSLQDEQIVLYADDSHNLSNLLIESNISANAIEENPTECTQPTTSQNLVASISTTATTSNNSDTAITSMKIKLKSFDCHTVKEKKGSQQKVTQPTPIVAPTIVSNQNPSTNLPTEDEEAILTSTEDEIDKEEPLSNHANDKYNAPNTATMTPSGKTSAPKSQNKSQVKKQPTFVFKSQLSAEQLKNGLRSTSDITFVQLYLALNKPSSIKLRYEWLPIKNESQSTNAELNVEVIDRQKFYLDVLSRVADSFLTEMKISQESLLESRLNSSNSNNNIQAAAAVAVGSVNANSSNSNSESAKAYQQTLSQQDDAINSIQAAIQQSNSNESSSGLENNNQDDEANSDQNNKAKKLLQDIQSKNRKSRQRKAIVVKSSRPVLPKSAEASSVTKTTSQNIVLSGPIEAVPRQIVSLADDRTSSKTFFLAPTSLPIASHNSYQVQPSIGNNLFYSMNNNVVQNGSTSFQMQIDDNNLVDFNNLSTVKSVNGVSGAGESAVNIVSSFQHSNIIPQIMANLISSDSNRNSAGYDNNGTASANMNIDMNNRVTHNNDASLMDASIHDSLFGLNENSNMSTLSLTNLLNSLQTKTMQQNSSCVVNSHDQSTTPVGIQQTQAPVQTQVHQQQQQQHQPIINNFYFNNLSQSQFNTAIVNNINTTNQTSSNYTVASSSFKRIDTNEWNDAMSDISLSGFINEIQSPEKRNLLNIINETSRDSLFFNTDAIMDNLTSPLKSKLVTNNF